MHNDIYYWFICIFGYCLFAYGILFYTLYVKRYHMLQHAFFPLNLTCILVNIYNSNFFVQTAEEAWVVWLYRNVLLC